MSKFQVTLINIEGDIVSDKKPAQNDKFKEQKKTQYVWA